jgi:hypothetical protein
MLIDWVALVLKDHLYNVENNEKQFQINLKNDSIFAIYKNRISCQL